MGERLSNAVFISYRRDVSQYMAMALWQNLTARGIDVFYDLESINAGHFDEIILSEIAARPYMVPILAPGTLNRCVNENDWLRRELQAAIECDRVLVPVHTPDFNSDDIDGCLPPELASELRRSQMLVIPPEYFKYAIQELAEEWLVPIAVDIAEASVEAAAAASQQTAAARQAKAVTKEVLTAEEHFAKAYDASMKGDFQASLAGWTEAIRLNPDYATAFYNRGIDHHEMGDDEAAIADYDEAIRLKPDYAEAYNNRGNSRHISHTPEDLEAAISDFSEAIRLQPNLAPAFYNRGHARHLSGDLEAAIADYDEAIRLDPDHELARGNRKRAVEARDMH